MLGGSNVSISHNSILNQLDQTSAVGLWAEQGDIRDVVVADNLLGGGSYTIYATELEAAMVDVQIVRNSFTRRFFPNVCRFGGPVIYPSGRPVGLIVSGNVVLETGAEADVG